MFPNYIIYILLLEWMLSNLWYIFLDCMSINFTVLSSDPVARYLPSAEKATLHTHSIYWLMWIRKNKINEMNEGRKEWSWEDWGRDNREILDKTIYSILSTTQKVGSLLIHIHIYITLPNLSIIFIIITRMNIIKFMHNSLRLYLYQIHCIITRSSSQILSIRWKCHSVYYFYILMI